MATPSLSDTRYTSVSDCTVLHNGTYRTGVDPGNRTIRQLVLGCQERQDEEYRAAQHLHDIQIGVFEHTPILVQFNSFDDDSVRG